MTNTIRRTTLMVRDMERSLRWYRAVLGLTVYYDDEVVLSGKGFPAGKAGDRTRLVILQADHPEIGMIGLLQWLEPVMPAPAEIPDKVTYGNPTFVVRTDDADAAWLAAVALGTHVHAEPHEWSVRGADGRDKLFLGVSLFDPDGYFFELNQLLGEPEN